MNNTPDVSNPFRRTAFTPQLTSCHRHSRHIEGTYLTSEDPLMHDFNVPGRFSWSTYLYHRSTPHVTRDASATTFDVARTTPATL